MVLKGNMKSSKATKQKFFDLGNKALNMISAEHLAGYICPICGIEFSADAIDIGNLTLEHAPPESFGGKPITLTCRNCNCPAGSSIDAAMTKRYILHHFFSGSQDFQRVRLKMGGQVINVDVKCSSNGIQIVGLPNNNRPNSFGNWQQHLDDTVTQQTWDGQNFRIAPVVTYNRWYAEVGDLKSAYLVAFAKFGYKYALHPRLEIIRFQIMNYQSRILKNFVLSDSATDHSCRRLVLLHQPAVCLLVQFGERVVFLPWLSGEDNLCEVMEKSVLDDRRIHCEGKQFSWPSQPEMILDFK